MKTILALSVFIAITSLGTTVSAQTSQKTDPETGQVWTKAPSDKYGPGGTVASISDKKAKLLSEVYTDKCGRVRECYTVWERKPPTTDYYDENGKKAVTVIHGRWGDSYIREPGNHHITAEEGKALVAKLEKTPSAPCPEKAEQPKEQPQPKGKNPLKTLLESVNVQIGIGGGHTVGGGDHNRGRHNTVRKTQKSKTISAGCKCHPCMCSHCTCH